LGGLLGSGEFDGRVHEKTCTGQYGAREAAEARGGKKKMQQDEFFFFCQRPEG
jgi:hypothetical protein